jgi:hypothetical protein
MSNYSFGAGFLFGTRTDIANSTPQLFGTLQDVSVEFSASTKQLFGQNQFAVMVARGQAKISCKAKMGSLSANLFNSLYFGGTMSSGSTAMAISEAGAIPASTAYTVTVSNSATFLSDEGAFYVSTGVPFIKVAGAPAVGQYSVSAGVYTFAAADASAAVLISYSYGVAASGQKITVTNQPVGSNPVFSAALFTQANTPTGKKTAVLNLRACVASKLSLATKIEDFTIPELDFDAFADASGNVFDWSFNEVS